jgi:hypothetical protein
MKNMLKMAFFDQIFSLIKVNFGQFFTGLKFARKSPFFGRIFFVKKSPSTFKSRPNGEKPPNLVTLIVSRSRGSENVNKQSAKSAIGNQTHDTATIQL